MTDLRPEALDTETHLIGPGAVVPRLVCCTFDDGEDSSLLSRDEALPRLTQLLTPGNGVLVVGHNLAFDLCSVVDAFPVLLPAVWEKLDRRECSDTMIREQLLNLSTHGKLNNLFLPRGGKLKIRYRLEDLVLNYLSVDLSAVKKGEDSWRLRFKELDGMPSRDYPPEAAEYAREDARFTMDVYRMQQDRVRSERGKASLSVDRFQTAAAFALLRITQNGMALDHAEFYRLQAQVLEALSDSKMEPLFAAGLLRRRTPSAPYVRQDKRARELMAEWTGCASDEQHDWERLEEGWRTALQDCGVLFKAAEEATKDQKATKHRVLCTHIAEAKGKKSTEVLTVYRDLKESLAAAEAEGVRYKLTDTGDVCTDKEVLEQLAHADPVLECLQAREKLQKMATTELPRMTWEGKPADVVHFCYQTLVETGRTSSYAGNLYPSANGQNVDPKARPVFVPRPGFLLCSCDYTALELVCVAQTTFDLFGHSVHRDKINAGVDPHAYLGTSIARMMHDGFGRQVELLEMQQAYEEFLKTKRGDPKFYGLWRKLAKPVGLGLPGGLGPQKLVEIARKDPYHVDFVRMAVERFEQFPEEFEVDGTVLYYAKKLHRMDEESFEWTSTMKGVSFAARLKRLWLDTYPEMVEYLKWVAQQEDDENPTILLGEVEEGEEAGEGDEAKGLCYTSPMGMHRAGATFTAVANGRAMQSPAAEGFKRAIFLVGRACEVGSLRGNRLVNQVHDELILEVRETEAHDLAQEVARLMVEGMRSVIRDVKVSASPCLMRRWYKTAEPVLDSGGRLIPWEPPQPKVTA